LKDKTLSRRQLLKGAGMLSTAGIIAAVAVAKHHSALADSSTKNNDIDGPLGAWLITVTPNLPPGVKVRPLGRVLTVINAGGTVIETDLAYLKSTPGMGAWVRTGKYTFEYNLIKHSVNPDGSYARAEHINQKNELNETFDNFTGKSYVTWLDAKGNAINHITAKIEATRIKVDTGTYPT
jgi:hypothetical protein